MKIKLSEHFDYKKLLKFTFPSIIMMIFTSIYSIVDGFFVSNYCGEISFASVNYIFPALMVLGSVGFMFGSGGSALISKTLGENNKEKANRLFSLFVYLIFIIGLILAIIAFIFLPDIAKLLGASDIMIDDCVIYGRIILISLPLNMLQYAFQTFFITAERADLGFVVTLIAGITNIVLDALFVGVFKWGIVGAAIATTISQILGGLIPVIYFALPNKSTLRLGKTNIDMPSIWQAASNGSSEFLSNVSASIVSMLYNAQLMKYAGEDGVSAYGVLMYVGMIFFAIFIGYSMGCAPIIGYHYGAKNDNEVKNVYKKSLKIILITSISMFILSLSCAKPFSMLFVGYSDTLLEITTNAFYIYSFVFLFSGIAIFGSSFFTALNNGPISALISFLRTAVFQVICILLLPIFWEINGIWISIVFADFFASIVSVICLLSNKKRYKY